MRDLAYLINDVRATTDNTDTNGVKDREFIRYFNDAVKAVQAIMFKNNPLCSYFQYSMDIASPVVGSVHALPSNTYADNAVSYVEVQSDAALTDRYCGLDRCWQEDQHSFYGWYTRNRSIVFSGRPDMSVGYAARAWFFRRLPKWDKAWATITNVAGQVLTLTVLDDEFSLVDNYITVVTAAGVVRTTGLKYVVTSATTITVTGDLTGVIATDQILMGANSTLAIDLPEEVEPYLNSYCELRVYGRNNYKEETFKASGFNSQQRAEIIAIFADAGQSIQRPPITDTDYLGI